MNIEKLQLKGLLVESKKEFRRLDTEASGLIILIRSLLNPYEEIPKIEIEKVIVSTKRLNEIIKQMKTLKEKISKLENEF